MGRILVFGTQMLARSSATSMPLMLIMCDCFLIVPEAAAYPGNRNIADIAASTVFNARPDALCVSGLTAGSETSAQTLKLVKAAVPDTPIFANTGVRQENVEAQLSVADGAIISIAFKKSGNTWNSIERTG